MLTALLATIVLALAFGGGGASTSSARRPVALARPVAAQAAVHPTSPETTPVDGSHCRGLVALTFDDGPQPGVTERLLHSLVALHAPAAFFMVGWRVQAYAGTARAVADAGFAIGNHTWEHVDLELQSDRQVRSALGRTTHALLRAGLPPTHLMRPPYGAIDVRVHHVVRSLGLWPVLWTIDSMDWKYGDARQIAHRIVAALRPGQDNLVLQHDGVARSHISIKAVPLVVRRARHLGYCFVGLDAHGHVVRPAGYDPRKAARRR
ncbi:hypothetical protein GCM10027076_24950 [Nocardioides montaniterrae]